MRFAYSLPVALVLSAVAACGSDDSNIADPPTTDAGTTTGPGGDPLPGSDGGTTGDATSSDSSSSDASNGTPADPDKDGPFPFAEKDANVTVASTNDTVAIHAAYPTGAGTFPVVVIGRGFRIPAAQYYSYTKRLASFGYVALTVEYPTPLTGTTNTTQAKDLLGGIDWAKADATFGAKVDANNAGTAGHSLGGRLALLAATLDARVKATIALDPVLSGGPLGCNAPACVDVAVLLPSLKIPTGFLGEITDATGGFQACAPAAGNYKTFYAKATSPSFQVTVLGANHMGFVDDVASCNVCGFCNPATASNADVNAMSRVYVAAFFERNLRGKVGYDTYLTGAEAQARYVTTKRATIELK
jgi:dienelactone hydrolase